MSGSEIGFVACECDDDVFVCLALEFFYPGFGFVERGLVEGKKGLVLDCSGLGSRRGKDVQLV